MGLVRDGRHVSNLMGSVVDYPVIRRDVTLSKNRMLRLFCHRCKMFALNISRKGKIYKAPLVNQTTLHFEMFSAMHFPSRHFRGCSSLLSFCGLLSTQTYEGLV